VAAACPAAPFPKDFSPVASAFASPVKFVREVRAEVGKVTWPSRRETLITTGLVLAMAALTAVFFLVVDQVIGFGVRFAFSSSV
jgi:preprotein translocase subunit SecE